MVFFHHSCGCSRRYSDMLHDFLNILMCYNDVYTNGSKCSRPIRLQDFLINYISRTKWWKSLIFACRYRFMENRSWLRNIGMGVVRNGCGHSVFRTLKLAVCQGKMNEINWFLVCWYNFMIKLKVTLTIFGRSCSKMGMVFKVLEL